LHIPLPVITIRHPVVVLEKCDKIWETLQLIKTVESNESESDDFNEEEEEEEDNEEEEEGGGGEKEEEMKEEEKEEEKQAQQSMKLSYIKNDATMECNNPVPLPFEFSVKRMKKLFPCSVCSKQYMEKRSLRKHSERVHGIIIPLQRRRKRKLLEKKEINPVVSPDKKDNSERFGDNASSQEKVTTNVTNVEVPTKEYAVSRYVDCVLCRRKVKSLREHLINYHKIGGSSNIVKLESSLLNEEKPSSSKTLVGTRKTMLKDILSGKPPQKHSSENAQDDSCTTNNEGNTDQKSVINMKRKYSLPYAKEDKRFKSNERYISIPKNTIIPRRKSINLITYKCDICLGTYASSHGLYKHRRVHFLRGETKENFHKFQCRYFNSPLTKRKLTKPPINNPIRKVTFNENKNENVQLNNLGYKRNTDSTVDEQNKKKRKTDDKPVCLCGKRFRYSHTLFIHQAKCKISREENEAESIAKLNNDKDSGLNITIKKRNDSYEIVKDEEKSPKSEHFEDDTSSLEHPAKNTIDTVQQESDASKYSKDHSILKLQIVDEDEIIDIENDLQTDKSDRKKSEEGELCTQENNEDVKSSLTEKSNNEKDTESEVVPGKVATLKQICQKVLNSLEAHTSTNVTEDKCQETAQKDNENKKQEIKQENIQDKDGNNRNKRELRSSNKRTRNMNEEYEYSYGDACIAKLELLSSCGYCNEEFSDNDAYNNHQCTVTEGKSFDEFSLDLICFYCNKVLSNYNDFDRHTRFEHFDRAFNCYQCTERFFTDKARLRHFHMEHSDLYCRFCAKKLSVSSKTLHEGYHLGFGYPCHICKKAYTNRKNLSYHKYTIHPCGADNIITCTLCLKPIKYKSFRGHMSAHKHNVCYFCGKVFSNRTGTEYHTMIHHGTNSKLKCNVCGTRFFTKKQLDKHEKIDGCGNNETKNKDAATNVKNH